MRRHLGAWAVPVAIVVLGPGAALAQTTTTQPPPTSTTVASTTTTLPLCSPFQTPAPVVGVNCDLPLPPCMTAKPPPPECLTGDGGTPNVLRTELTTAPPVTDLPPAAGPAPRHPVRRITFTG